MQLEIPVRRRWGPQLDLVLEVGPLLRLHVESSVFGSSAGVGTPQL